MSYIGNRLTSVKTHGIHMCVYLLSLLKHTLTGMLTFRGIRRKALAFFVTGDFAPIMQNIKSHVGKISSKFVLDSNKINSLTSKDQAQFFKILSRFAREKCIPCKIEDNHYYDAISQALTITRALCSVCSICIGGLYNRHFKMQTSLIMHKSQERMCSQIYLAKKNFFDANQHITWPKVHMHITPDRTADLQMYGQLRLHSIKVQQTVSENLKKKRFLVNVSFCMPLECVPLQHDK